MNFSKVSKHQGLGVYQMHKPSFMHVSWAGEGIGKYCYAIVSFFEAVEAAG